MTYTHSFSPVDYQSPVFPLPIVYAVLSFLLFSGLYIMSLTHKVKGLVGYVGLTIFFCFLLIFEFFSGKGDVLTAFTALNFNQLLALIAIGFCGKELYKLVKIK